MLALMLCFEVNLDVLAIVPPENESLGRVFFMECILTFILVFVIFTVAFENLEAKKKKFKLLKVKLERMVLLFILLLLNLRLVSLP